MLSFGVALEHRKYMFCSVIFVDRVRAHFHEVVAPNDELEFWAVCVDSLSDLRYVVKVELAEARVG